MLRQGRQESGQPRPLHRQAGTEALLGFYGSSTSAKPPQKSLMIMEKGMQSAAGQARQLTAFYLPPSPGGETNGQAPTLEESKVLVIHNLDII